MPQLRLADYLPVTMASPWPLNFFNDKAIQIYWRLNFSLFTTETGPKKLKNNKT
jgi:hypothetical protein